MQVKNNYVKRWAKCMQKMWKKLFSAALAGGVLIGSFSGCTAVKQPYADKTLNLEGMQLVFEEQFDGELDRTVWDTTADTPVRRGGYWDPAQCYTQDGNLIIRTEYKEDGAYGPGWYTGTCRSIGLKEFTYGYFEVRCKAPAAEGIWSAFWMQSENMRGVTDGGKSGAEIDIMESPYYNDPKMPAEKYRNTTMHTIHVDGYGEEHSSRISKQYAVQNDMYNEFNTYGLLWTEDEYIFYINGQETWRTKWGVSQVPEYLWLSVEIAGETDSANPANPDNRFTFSGDIRNNPEGAFPTDFVVDYVRVYQIK